MIHITDGQYGEILDFVTAKNILENNLRQSKKDNLEIFEFTTFADKRFSQYLAKRNRVIIPDEDQGYKEFIIHESGKFRDFTGLMAKVYTKASYLELKKAKVMDPQTFSKQTATTLVSHTTNGTEWRPGIIEGSGIRTMHIEKHTNRYAFLKRIATEFGLELRFRVETDGNKVTGRYVDLIEQVGQWRGREIELGKDLIGLRRIEKTDNIFTALKGLGPEREDGSRLEVIVEDKEALQRWGRPDPITGELQHLWDTYEPQTNDQEMTKSRLRELTENELEKRVNEVVEYEGDIADLEHVPGMENKKIRFGDTIKIKDTKFNPPLYLEARVHTQDRSITDKSKKKVTLGDYIEYTEEEVNAIWQSLQDEIRKKIGIDKLKEYAEPKKIESDTPPNIKEGENPIWVDTSRNPRVSYVANSGEWMKMTPTTPEEVNAYNKQQVDEKAEQTLKDAKAFSKNANNITEGIIDVDSVPIRNSVTGAGLKWDGVNGLVQYDANGDPVSWLDLSANAHFANAFLSGRVEALEGFFGDNLRLRDGKVEMVREDGAVSISSGMVRNGLTVVGNDPHFMTSGNAETGAFQSFVPGGTTESTSFHIYGATKGSLDGRGLSGINMEYYDVRDALGALAFQKYHFIHSARYLVFRFRKYSGSKISVHVMEGSSEDTNDRLYFEILENGTSGVEEFQVDLGVPDFKLRTVTFKIGWTHGWGDRMEFVRFIMERVFLTDFL
ncbi:phage tail spike protein [Virgibacillus salexigens]|uniref:phage tail spike protein n=1 Tax=Virgibacillus salexigens TaxID=61016 RepID=UPI003081F793